jgi:hypothetical protein
MTWEARNQRVRFEPFQRLAVNLTSRSVQHRARRKPIVPIDIAYIDITYIDCGQISYSLRWKCRTMRTRWSRQRKSRAFGTRLKGRSLLAPLDFNVSWCFDANMIFCARATLMLRTAVLLGTSFAMLGAAVAQDAKEDAKGDTVQVHGKSLTLSCTEWKRNQDGSWMNTSPLLVGTDTVNSVTVHGKDAQSLEAKCGSGSTTTAKPAPTDDSIKHARHKHHGAAPSDGT